MVPSCIQVAIYDNRIEVTSPGALYGDLTLEEAIQGRSMIRNPAIAEVFSRMGIIEEWGSGLRRIVKLTHEYGLPKPEFTAFPSSFRVSIYRHEQKAEKKKPIEKSRIEKPIEKADYLHLQEAILTYIDAYGSIRNKEARRILNKAESTSKRFLNTMVQEGLLEAIGEKRQRIYVKKESSLLTTSHRRKK